MNHLASTAKRSLPIRELALSLVADLPRKAWNLEIARLFSFVQHNIRYVKDIRGVETVQTPLRTLQYQAGDCDDMSTLLAALLESIGYRARYKAVGFAPNVYQHVYVQVFHDGRWIGLDPTEPVGVGWEPPNPVAVMTKEID